MSDENGKWGKRDYRATVIVRAYGDPEMTDKCLQSIGNLDGVHLVLIDQEGLWDRWRALSDKPDSRIHWHAPLEATTVVRTHENVGAVRATNIGLQLAMLDTSPIIIVLDNDVEVPEGDTEWLDRWLAHFDDKDVAAAGAVSDRVSGLQCVESYQPRYTKDFKADDEQGVVGQIVTPWLISFACAYRKDALVRMPSPTTTLGTIRSWLRKEAGPGLDDYRYGHLWDERFSPGQWEDIDVSIRLTCPWALESRWKLVVAQDVYFHHRCHESFKKLGNFDELLVGNIKKGCEKWTLELVRLIGQAVVAQDS